MTGWLFVEGYYAENAMDSHVVYILKHVSLQVFWSKSVIIFINILKRIISLKINISHVI